MAPSLVNRLQTGEPLLGTVLACPDPALAELAGLRFDLAWIDLEHGALDIGDVPPLVLALHAADCAALVRLPDHRFERVTALLDVGIDGIVVPRLQSEAAAAEVAARMSYPPRGVRGYAARRATSYGRSDAPAHCAASCLVQIESRAAVSAAAAIAAVDGIDALVVGTADLALDLGVPLDLAAPAMAHSLASVRQAAHRAGVAFGIAAAGDPNLIAGAAGGPPDVVIYSADVRIYAEAMDAVAVSLAARGGQRSRPCREPT